MRTFVFEYRREMEVNEKKSVGVGVLVVNAETVERAHTVFLKHRDKIVSYKFHEVKKRHENHDYAMHWFSIWDSQVIHFLSD